MMRRRPSVLKEAVALEYHRGRDGAPLVTASGRGIFAEQIIELARQHGVYVQPDPDLVHVLAQLDLGAEIPPQLYYAIAEILAFVYNLNSGPSQLPAKEHSS